MSFSSTGAAWSSSKFKESKIRPNIKNNIGCVGLIQFCPDKGKCCTKTIKGVTYNLSDIQNSGLAQLDYVEKYFKALGFNSSKPASAGDLYGATFYPISKNKPKDQADVNPIIKDCIDALVSMGEKKPVAKATVNKYFAGKNSLSIFANQGQGVALSIT